jgi:hypothetical protein
MERIVVHKDDASEPLWTGRVFCPGCKRSLKVLTVHAHLQGACKGRRNLTAEDQESIATLYRDAMRLYMRERHRRGKARQAASSEAVGKENVSGSALKDRCAPLRPAAKLKASQRPSILALLDRTKKGMHSGLSVQLSISGSSSLQEPPVCTRCSSSVSPGSPETSPSKECPTSVRAEAETTSEELLPVESLAGASRTSSGVTPVLTVPSIFRRRGSGGGNAGFHDRLDMFLSRRS